MRRIFTAVAAMFMLMCSSSFAQSPAADKPAAEKPPGEVSKAYLPGLEVFMAIIQRDHDKLWFAARSRNWELAEYQLGEMKEAMGDVQDFIPTYKQLPVKDMIDAVITGPIADMEQAIESRSYRRFVASFDAITAACNSCHEGAGRGFIRIRRPLRNAYSNQLFEPKK